MGAPPAPHPWGSRRANRKVAPSESHLQAQLEGPAGGKGGQWGSTARTVAGEWPVARSRRPKGACEGGAWKWEGSTSVLNCIATAKEVDKKFNGIDYDNDGPGPVLQRLQSYDKVEGLVVGAHDVLVLGSHCYI